MHGVRRSHAGAPSTLGILALSAILLALFALLVVVVATPAHAHVVLPRLQATRRTVIDLGAEPSLDYAISLGPRQAFLARQEADANRDGEVDPSEGSVLVDRFTQQIGKSVSLVLRRPGEGVAAGFALGKLRVASTSSSGLVGATDATGATGDAQTPSLAVHCSWALPIDDGVDRIQITDALVFEPFEHSEVEVRDAPSHRFVGIGVDEQRLSASPHLAFVEQASTGPHVVWVVFQPSPRGPFPFVSIALALAVVAIVAVFAVGRRVIVRARARAKHRT